MQLHHAIDRPGTEGYFASANGKKGFYSLYSEIYNEKNYKKLYILKGGPGTGKSTLLDKLAARASELGMTTEVLLCSSDAKSLDGVIINELGVGVLDGTAPHAQEPFYPGVCGEIVNLGENWNGERLGEVRNSIELLFLKKSSAYDRAYRYLAAAGLADEDIINGITAATDTEKLRSAVKRILRKYTGREKDNPVIKNRFVNAYATGGAASLDTLYKKSKQIATVNYSYGAGRLFLDAVKEEGIERGLSMTVAPVPLSPEHTEAVLFEDSGLLFTIADADEYEKGDICVNTKRFVNNRALSERRMKQRFSEKMKASLIKEALNSLGEAGRVHAEIEELYKSAMDFDLVSETSERLSKKIFG